MRKLKQGVFALLILALATFIGACETEIHDEGVSAPLSSSTKEQSSRLESEALSYSTEETSSLDSELSAEESDASSEETVLPEDSFSDSLEESESSSETSEDAPTSSPAESSSDGRFELPEDKFN